VNLQNINASKNADVKKSFGEAIVGFKHELNCLSEHAQVLNFRNLYSTHFVTPTPRRNPFLVILYQPREHFGIGAQNPGVHLQNHAPAVLPSQTHPHIPVAGHRPRRSWKRRFRRGGGSGGSGDGIRVNGGDSSRREDPARVDPSGDAGFGGGREGERGFGVGFGLARWKRFGGGEVVGARGRDGEGAAPRAAAVTAAMLEMIHVVLGA